VRPFCAARIQLALRWPLANGCHVGAGVLRRLCFVVWGRGTCAVSLKTGGEVLLGTEKGLLKAVVLGPRFGSEGRGKGLLMKAAHFLQPDDLQALIEIDELS
jgi:hypothetical protein